MRRMLTVTPELTRQYAGQNVWQSGRGAWGTCGELGPNGGFCTLKKGHGGLTHVAHNYSHSSGYDLDQIYRAWVDGDPDLDVDEGL